jgi:serine protease Do
MCLYPLFAAVFIFFAPHNASAESSIYVTVDGKVLSFEQPPVNVNGSTLVPLRGIFESLGAKVFWDSETHTASAFKDGTEISLQVGSTTVYKNKQPILLEVPAQIINGSTLVPVRFIGEALGCGVKWDESSHTVLVASPQSSSKESLTLMQKETKPSDNKLTTEDIGKLQNRIVYIEVLDKSGKSFASGSGVVVSSDGGIITNYHVIKDGYGIKVEFPDHSTYTTTKVLNEDPDKDLAYLKINASNLPVIAFGDSSKTALGESVVAIGSPQGLKNTLSTGVISTVNREIDGHTFLQTSAPIDHGSSGGALFNMEGQLIGITSAGFESTASLNLAIPSNIVKEFINSPEKPRDMSKQPAISIKSAKDLQAYLKENLGEFPTKEHTYHFEYLVDTSSDGHYNVNLIMTNGQEILNLLDEHLKSNLSFIPGLLTAIGKECADLTNDDRVLTAVWFSYNFRKYPSSFPASSIKAQSDGTYDVFFAQGKVLLDTKGNTVRYYPEPMTDKSKYIDIPLSK